jgi:membrane protein DedA with SNARE-associated domain
VTPSIVSGALAMRFRQFVIWNFLAGTAFVLAVGPAAYGAGAISTGHHDATSVGMLIGGIAVGAVCIILAVRHRRRRKARRADVGTPAEPSDPAVRGSP